MSLVIISFIIFVFLHWIIANFTNRKGIKHLVSTAIIIGFFPYYLGDKSYSEFEFFSVYLMLIMFYLHLHIGIERSVSIRVLNEITISPDNKITRQNLERSYPINQMFRHRIQLMTKNNWLIEQDGKFYVSGKSNLLVLVTNFSRKLYGLENTW